MPAIMFQRTKYSARSIDPSREKQYYLGVFFLLSVSSNSLYFLLVTIRYFHFVDYVACSLN